MLFAASELEGAENSLLSRLKSVETSVGRIAEVYPRAEEFYARLHAAALDLKDLASEAASGADRIDADPRRLEQVTARLDRIYSLQQKHRVASVSELLALQARYEAQLADIEGGAEAIARMQQRVYPARMAFFCSSILLRSSSVMVRFTVLMARFWSTDWMCMVTIWET